MFPLEMSENNIPAFCGHRAKKSDFTPFSLGFQADSCRKD
jgi:hypothetical protein